MKVSNPRLRWLVPLAVVAAAASIALASPLRHEASQLMRGASDPHPVEGALLTSFPKAAAGLDPARAQIIDVAHRQFGEQHRGTFYADGVDEPWCADFVSWVMQQAGQPLDNPNSGSWRIPGVATLQDYYQELGRFQPTGSDYQPQPGDVVMYGPESPFHQHANIVVTYDGDLITTVGGAEPGGIALHRFALAGDPGVVGFGTP